MLQTFQLLKQKVFTGSLDKEIIKDAKKINEWFIGTFHKTFASTFAKQHMIWPGNKF